MTATDEPDETAYLNRLDSLLSTTVRLQQDANSLHNSPEVSALFSSPDSRRAKLERCREVFTASAKPFPSIVNSDTAMIRLINDIRAFRAEKTLIDFFMGYREGVAAFLSHLSTLYEEFLQVLYPRQMALFDLSMAIAASFASNEDVLRYAKRMGVLRKRAGNVLDRLQFLTPRNAKQPASDLKKHVSKIPERRSKSPRENVFLTTDPDASEDDENSVDYESSQHITSIQQVNEVENSHREPPSQQNSSWERPQNADPIRGGSDYLRADFCSEHTGSLSKLLDSVIETIRLERNFILTITAEIAERRARTAALTEELNETRATLRKKQKAYRLAQTAAGMFRKDLGECHRDRKSLELELSSCQAKLESLGRQKELRKSLLEFLNLGMPSKGAHRLQQDGPEKLGDIEINGSEQLGERSGGGGKTEHAGPKTLPFSRKRQEIERRIRHEQTIRLRTEQQMRQVSVELREVYKRSVKLERRAENFESLCSSLHTSVREGKALHSELRSEKKRLGGEELSELKLLFATKICEESAERLDERPATVKISKSVRNRVRMAVKSVKDAARERRAAVQGKPTTGTMAIPPLHYTSKQISPSLRRIPQRIPLWQHEKPRLQPSGRRILSRKAVLEPLPKQTAKKRRAIGMEGVAAEFVYATEVSKRGPPTSQHPTDVHSHKHPSQGNTSLQSPSVPGFSVIPPAAKKGVVDHGVKVQRHVKKKGLSKVKRKSKY